MPDPVALLVLARKEVRTMTTQYYLGDIVLTSSKGVATIVDVLAATVVVQDVKGDRWVLPTSHIVRHVLIGKGGEA